MANEIRTPGVAEQEAGTREVGIEEMLKQRKGTHGSFPIHASCTQEMKSVVRSHLKLAGKTLNPSQQEAIDMIIHKIGRIVAGDASFQDHWDDIQGYAKIGNPKD